MMSPQATSNLTRMNLDFAKWLRALQKYSTSLRFIMSLRPVPTVDSAITAAHSSSKVCCCIAVSKISFKTGIMTYFPSTAATAVMQSAATASIVLFLKSYSTAPLSHSSTSSIFGTKFGTICLETTFLIYSISWRLTPTHSSIRQMKTLIVMAFTSSSKSFFIISSTN